MKIDWSKLSDSEIIELEELYRLRDIDDLRSGLLNPNTKSPNYQLLFESIKTQEYDSNKKLIKGNRGCALEGSSRSTKTWSGVDIIIWLTEFVHKDAGCTINIYRETYNEFKTTLYDDFKRRLDDFELNNPFHKAKEVKSFKIGKSTVFFLGDGKHGGGCDYAFYNEVMFLKQNVFDQSEMRCRKFWWMDYNPSVTDHWVFDNVLTRPDVAFLRTTYKDNPFISPGELNKILGYEPWESDSYVVMDGEIYYNGDVVTEKNQPPPNIKNIEAGTADEFNWKVYGLGLRGAMKGVIFNHVEWIDQFPDIGYSYGMDFGFTVDPTTLVKHAEDDYNIWLELLCYQPIETPGEISDYMEAIGIEKELPITADSSDKHVSENKGTIEMVKGLRKLGWKVSKVSKTKGVMYWINSMKQKKIHIVKNQFYIQAKKEKENYRMKEINGIAINQPIDAFNHFWDGGRYGHMAWNGSSQTFTTTPEELKKLNL